MVELADLYHFFIEVNNYYVLSLNYITLPNQRTRP